MKVLLPVALVLLLQQPQAACDSQPRSDQPDGGESAPTGDVYTAGDGTRFLVETFARNLEVPWALAFASDGRLFVTERPGRVRVIRNGQLLGTPALTLTDISATGESGLLGIALHPAFASTRWVYLFYTASTPGGTVNRLVRYREVNDQLGERAVLLDDIPASAIHDGSRVKFGPDGRLYVTTGDAANPALSQDLGSYAGKILRLNHDGTTPADNPLASPIYSYGHRNPQGIDWHPQTGELWATEHGPTGFDELNRILPGRNYGWPVIVGGDSRPDMETPVAHYSPAIAPSGMTFYGGTAIPAFNGDLFFGTLRGMHLRRVRLSGTQVITQEALMTERYGRIRDVVFGPDGFLYFTTSNRDGRATPAADDDRILRIRPAP